MTGEKALKFLRFLKKPISEDELNDFYKLYKEELESRVREELYRFKIKEIKAGDYEIKLVADASVPEDEIWFVGINGDTQKIKINQTLH